MEKNYLTAINAAINAGLAICKIYNSDDFDISEKNDKSPLTKADLASNEIIIKALEYTNLPIISEETKQTPFEIRKNWSKVWLVDPLDGTKEFIKRNGQFTVNIALIERNITKFGVIYVPATKNLYFGVDNLGSFFIENITNNLNSFDEAMKTGKRLPLFDKNENKTVVIASKSHFNEDTEKFIDNLKKKYSNVELTNIGSSLKLCKIADGSADIYPRYAPTMEWDIAAGHAILKSAGGNVLIAGTKNELSYNKENLLNPYFVATKIFDF